VYHRNAIRCLSQQSHGADAEALASACRVRSCGRARGKHWLR
jgi:hypothetical protein